jgi:hypothetical protein
MKIIITIICLCTIISTQLQAQGLYGYKTPWYAVIALRGNVASYNHPVAAVKANQTYFDITSVRLGKKGYSDFGIPFAGHVMKLLLTGNLNNDNLVGEVSYMYLKGGRDIINVGAVEIGIGASAISTFLFLPNNISGYVRLKYGGISPLIYAKINVGKILIAPVFEYNVVPYTDNPQNIKLSSFFTLSSYVVLPINKKFAININPYFEKKKFKPIGTSNIPSMSSNNLGIKVGLMVSM